MHPLSNLALLRGPLSQPRHVTATRAVSNVICPRPLTLGCLHWLRQPNGQLNCPCLQAGRERGSKETGQFYLSSAHYQINHRRGAAERGQETEREKERKSREKVFSCKVFKDKIGRFLFKLHLKTCLFGGGGGGGGSGGGGGGCGDGGGGGVTWPWWRFFFSSSRVVSIF